jgi:hypothetical protein
VAATVVLAGVTDVPRVRTLRAIAIEASVDSDDRAGERDDALAELMAEGEDRLETLF